MPHGLGSGEHLRRSGTGSGKPSRRRGCVRFTAGRTQPREDFSDLQLALKDHLYRTQKLRLSNRPELKEVSTPGESEGDFRIRITHRVKEIRDLQVEKLRAKFVPKLAILQEKLRKASQRVEKEKIQANSQSMAAAISFGTSILGAVFGRKRMSANNLGKAATTVLSAGRVAGARQDVTQAEETVGAIQQRLDDLNRQFESDAQTLLDGVAPDRLKLEAISIAPKKTEIKIVLCWTPWTVDVTGNATAVW